MSETGSLAAQNMRLFQDKNELISKYQDIFVQSLLTSFGLDLLFFGGIDQRGGTVDTIHNAREGVYSKQYDNAAKYDLHIENLDWKEKRKEYNSHENFKNKGREYKEDLKNGTLRDAYTGRLVSADPESKHYQVEKEHIIAAKYVETDRGRFLSGADPVALASHSDNLVPIIKSINAAKRDMTAHDFITYLDTSIKKFEDQITNLERKAKESHLSEGQLKNKKELEKKLERFKSVDKEKLLEAWEKSSEIYNKKINLKYYLGKEFLSQTGKETFKAGWRMGSRQVLGLVFMEVWKALRAEWPSIMETWRGCDGWREKLDIRPVLQHVKKVIMDAVTAVKTRWHDVLSEMKDGFLSGVLSALTTTIINIFETTARNIMRLVRNFWSSIVGALRIMKSDEYLTREEKTLAVMRLLSVSVAGILQPIITECVEKFLLPYLSYPYIRGIVSEFVGAFCSGIVSVTLVYFIDNSPIVRNILTMVGDVVVNTVNIVGKGAGLTVSILKKTSETYLALLSSPASQCLKIACTPLMMAVAEQKDLLEGLDGKMDEQISAITNVGERVEGLKKQVKEGFSDLEKVVEKQTHILASLLDKQGKQLTDAIEALRQDVKRGFADTHAILEENKQENESLQFREKVNFLLRVYQDCVRSVMEPGLSPGEDDLKRVIDAVYSLDSWLEARLQGPFKQVGDPRRLPFLSARVLAVQLEADTRHFRKGPDGLSFCQDKRMALSSLLKAEVEMLSKDKLFDLLGNSYLIEQYVLLNRAVKQIDYVAAPFQMIGPESSMSLLGRPELFVWNDGLSAVRQAMETLDDAPSGPEPEVLVNHQGGNTNWYGDGTVSGLKNMLGIPEDHILSAGTVFSLFCEFPKAQRVHRDAIQLEFAA